MSGFLPASLVPIMVIALLKESVKLLIASVIREIECAIKPIVAFAPTSKRFAPIPIIEVPWCLICCASI